MPVICNITGRLRTTPSKGWGRVGRRVARPVAAEYPVTGLINPPARPTSPRSGHSSLLAATTQATTNLTQFDRPIEAESRCRAAIATRSSSPQAGS
jgi:hypothetical protein